MLANRSMPRCAAIPQLAYPDVSAVEWLCDAFGFTLRIGMGNHRAQLNVGEGAIVVTEQRAGESRPSGEHAHHVMVRVEDVDRHHERSAHHGARIVRPPADFPYGERQYTVEDFAGYRWTFSQSVADVAPEEWGGTSGLL